jgi:Spy/CpxP family protein refolding chaperone
MKLKQIAAFIAAGFVSSAALAQAPAPAPTPSSTPAPAAGKPMPPKKDPKLDQCMRAVDGTHREIMDIMGRARAAGRIDPKEQQEFERMDRAIKGHHSQMAKDGLTVGECESTLRALQDERAKVRQMASTRGILPPPPGK